MASERPEGLPGAVLAEIIPITSKISRAKMGDAKRAPATVRDIFSGKTPTPKLKDMQGAMVDHLFRSATDLIESKDRHMKVRFQQLLSEKVRARKGKLVERNKTKPLDYKPEIKDAKHEVVMDVITALTQLDLLGASPVINLDHYRISIDPMKGPIEDANIHILNFYKSLFERNEGLMSFHNFDRLNTSFRNDYWLTIKSTIRMSPEYRILKSLVGDKLDTVFLKFATLENLIQANDDSLIAAWCQYRSVAGFLLTSIKSKPQDAKMQETQVHVTLRQELLQRKIGRFAETGFKRTEPALKKRFLVELEQEIERIKAFIKNDILEIKEFGNVVLLPTRMNQLRGERENVMKVEEKLKVQAQKDAKVFQTAFADLLQFLVQDPLKKTPLYRSLSQWSPEATADFAEWLYDAMKESSAAEALTTRDLFRARVCNILSPKKR